MSNRIIIAFCSCCLFAGGASADDPPVKVIFDTDMDTDCDDAGELAVLHALADLGELTILATPVSSRYRWSVPCTEAINRYYGRGDLPIGSPKGRGAGVKRGSRYARQIAQSHQTKFKNNSDAPSAATVSREVLASQPDESVVVVTVGYLTNLRDLLASGPDQFSNLPGPQLAERKVWLWVCMGGRHPKHLKRPTTRSRSCCRFKKWLATKSARRSTS